MAGVETMLRSMLEGRRQRWTVIILIGLVLLVLGLPAADEYIALRQREQELSAAYRVEQSQLERREQLEQRANQIDGALAKLTTRGLTDETENDFRNKLVELTRGTGCQLRRLNLETANFRPWLKEDHPLKKAERGRNKKKQEESATGFDLRSQSVLLSVSGKTAEIEQLLAALASTGKLVQTQTLSIRPAGNSRDSVVMELQFTAFGLTKSKRKMQAA